jgi:hypothetical protein
LVSLSISCSECVSFKNKEEDLFLFFIFFGKNTRRTRRDRFKLPFDELVGDLSKLKMLLAEHSS